jgi:hypothetical protein
MPESSPIHFVRGQVIVAPPNDPAELEALSAIHRQRKKTPQEQIGCLMVVDTPLPLLAQYIAELPVEEQQEFLQELLARLPAEALLGLDETLQQRLGRGVA